MSDEYDLEYDEDDSGYSAGYSDGYDDGCAESAELCDALDAAEARVAWLEGMAEELSSALKEALSALSDQGFKYGCEHPVDLALDRFNAGQDTEA